MSEELASQPVVTSLFPVDVTAVGDPVTPTGDLYTNWIKYGYHPQMIAVEGQIPVQNQWIMPPVFKLNVSGTSRLYWQAGFDGYNSILTWHGYYGGAIMLEVRQIELARQHTFSDQALQDIRQRYNVKYHENYRGINDVEMPFPSVMLAETYKDTTKISYPVLLQPKYDGIRMVARLAADGTIQTNTRQNHSLNHAIIYIEPALRALFAELGPVHFIDGELFMYEKPDGSGLARFETIQSVVSTRVTQHAWLPYLQYWIFDIYPFDDEPFEMRWGRIERAFASLAQQTKMAIEKDPAAANTITASFDRIKISYSYLALNKQGMNEYFQGCLRSGFEGIMIHLLANGSPPGSSAYKLSLYAPGKRSKGLLKMKPVYDAEALVIGFAMDKGRSAGAILFELQMKNGNTFTAVPIGVTGRPLTIAQRRRMYEHRERYRGQEVTYKFQELGNDGRPRFPKVIRWPGMEEDLRS